METLAAILIVIGVWTAARWLLFALAFIMNMLIDRNQDPDLDLPPHVVSRVFKGANKHLDPPASKMVAKGKRK